MYKHYTTVALRNLVKHKIFSIINIVGLALGMTCFIMIMLWIRDEKQIDNFHSNGESLFTVYQTFTYRGQVSGTYATPLGYANGEPFVLLDDDLKQSIPEIKYVACFATNYEQPWGHPETFQVGNKIHKFEGASAGKDFFNMFSYPIISGDSNEALKDISSLAISRKMSDMFFESPMDAIGKSIRFENQRDFLVTAVFENIPSKSSLKFDYLISWEAHTKGGIAWASGNAQTFIQLEKKSDAAAAAKKVNQYLQTQLDKDVEYKVEVGLQKFGEQYLHGNFINGKLNGGRIEYVNIFSGVAIFIMIIACINFMNLSTARSIKRAKEIGIRKAIGSSRLNLIGQFFGESIMLSFMGLILSIPLILVFLAPFNNFTGKEIEIPLNELWLWLILPVLVLVTGFVAGSYPAIFLSSLKPVRVLKGKIQFTKVTIWFRKGLVIFQFSLSIILLISTLVITLQTKYVRTTNLGYDRENLIYIRFEGELNKKYNTFKALASGMPGIVMIDRSSETPHAMRFAISDAIKWEGQSPDDYVGFNPASVGYDFLKLMNLKLVEGRDFSRANGMDSSAFMLNETAVNQMGLKDPLGKWVSAWEKKGPVIGVLKDYHTNSLHDPILPLIIDVKEDLDFGVMIVRTEAGKTEEALSSLEKTCKLINPNYPFAYQFVDQEFDKLYKNERAISKLSNIFAGLAIIISCLGLLGLAMFSTEQRTKEIGIRKALGARSIDIVGLLSKDFLMVVFQSFLVAAPIAGYIMSQWLQSFAFKIELSWWIYACVGLAVLLIAFLTICVHTVQSAVASPVGSLKTD